MSSDDFIDSKEPEGPKGFVFLLSLAIIPISMAIIIAVLGTR